MSRQLRLVVRAVCASFAMLLGLPSLITPGSQPGRVTPDAKELANKILESPAARFMSGSALNALRLVGGGVPIHHSLGVKNSTRTLPFTASKFQVIVNDPSKDAFSDLDITTQSETAVATFGSSVVVTYNNDRQFFFTSNSVMGYSLSTDGGATFSDLGLMPAPSIGFNFGDPALVANTVGSYYAASIALDFTRSIQFQQTLGISKSVDGGLTFSTPVSPAEVSGNPPEVFHFADKEFIAVDTSGGAFNGNIYVSWTDFRFNFDTGEVQFPIVFSRSTDGGASFSAPVQIAPTGDFDQGSAPAVGPSGEVYVTYFRFPQTISQDGSEILVAKSTDGGVTFGAPVLVATIKPIGFLGGQTALLGNFRVNSFPRIDVDPLNGNVYITYAANPAVPGRSDSGDCFFVRSTDGGATWSVPIRVNDDPGTNDQFFPTLAVNRQGVIEAIWYDKRLDPRNLTIDVFKARSTDGGLSFGPNHRVTLTSFFPAVGYDPIINPIYMGDYIDIKTETRPDGRGLSFFLAWGDCRRIITTPQGTRPDQDVFFSTDR